MADNDVWTEMPGREGRPRVTFEKKLQDWNFFTRGAYKNRRDTVAKPICCTGFWIFSNEPTIRSTFLRKLSTTTLLPIGREKPSLTRGTVSMCESRPQHYFNSRQDTDAEYVPACQQKNPVTLIVVVIIFRYRINASRWDSTTRHNDGQVEATMRTNHDENEYDTRNGIVLSEVVGILA